MSQPSRTILGPARSAAPGPATAQVIRAGDLVFLGNLTAQDEAGRLVGRGDVEEQTRTILQIADARLREAGGSLADIVDVVSFHTVPRDIERVMRVAREMFGEEGPAWTPVGFCGAVDPGALVMLRARAHVGRSPKRRLSSSEALPPSVRWTASACRVDELVFIAGQSSNEPVDHRGQAVVAYADMMSALHEAGGNAEDILDFSSFHHDIRGAVPTLEWVYIPDVMGADRPTESSATTSHIGSTGLRAPQTLGTYTAIADLTTGPRVASTPDAIWWKDKYPIAGAARKPGGRLITVAGHVASAPDGSILHPGDAEGQARAIFVQMQESLAGLGANLQDVVEVSSFHKDARTLGIVSDVAGEFFDRDAAVAWTFATVPGLWFEGYLHEIAALALVP